MVGNDDIDPLIGQTLQFSLFGRAAIDKNEHLGALAHKSVNHFPFGLNIRV